ncbi:MAG TPA: class I SAM-dependent methyltransferase [Aggregatilinea sp.]|jgi:SAM-dependent methyltransferase|uniref:class I SAM-dependent methyltransferase n=1 Tax=Aggregatilinea sp. TaxID=2806333 RepID=UPI002C1930A0|nr:class I SAM-dependent methyltransferase [Aggregatilinea sp.]HML22582.1 class I SAM-dependent methyltransferase [Aggregatilinea sp.]
MSDLYDSTRESWEDIWQDASVEFELQAIEQPRAYETLGVYTGYLDKEGIILEAGSGLGAVLFKLRALGFNVIGLDYAENALHTVHDYDPTMRMQVGDVHALPYRDNSLHGYLSFGVLEHFQQGVLPALLEANRVLAPGGTLVLTIPYPNVVYKLVQLKRRLLKRGALTDEEFFESTYTQHQLVAALQEAGFEIALVRPTSHSYTLRGLGWPFKAKGYYRTTWLADRLGAVLRVVAPWPFNFTTMLIARKVRHAGH